MTRYFRKQVCRYYLHSHYINDIDALLPMEQAAFEVMEQILKELVPNYKCLPADVWQDLLSTDTTPVYVVVQSTDETDDREPTDLEVKRYVMSVLDRHFLSPEDESVRAELIRAYHHLENAYNGIYNSGAAVRGQDINKLLMDINTVLLNIQERILQAPKITVARKEKENN